MSIKVRILVGASHAYACIQGADFSLDVALNGGKSAADSLAQTIAEDGETVRRLMRRMERMQQAADILRAQDAAVTAIP